MKYLKNSLNFLIMFGLGGFIYGGVEILYRGESHISMFLTGGICFLIINNIKINRQKPELIIQVFIASIIITCIEFIVGLIVNIWLKWNVWDYSTLPYNIMGQICLRFFLYWVVLSFLAIIFYDYIQYKLFNKPKRVYHILSVRN